MQAWLNKDALGAMMAEAEARFPLETGGLLMGYWADGKPVITTVTGPGPAATHAPTTFTPDYAWQTAECEKMADSWYLGDWHTHPMGSTELSTLDKQALQNIADCEAAQAPRPLMLVLGGTLDVLSLYMLSQGQIVGLDMTTYEGGGL